MYVSDSVLFSLHQFVLLTLCIFFLYFAWKDLFSGTFDHLKSSNRRFVGAILVAIWLGMSGLLLMEWGAQGIVLALCFGFLISFSIYDPKYAVAFFTFLLISRPWEIITDPMMSSMPRDIFMLCFFSFLGHKIIRKKFYFQWNYATACVAFFALWTFFSLLTADHMAYGMTKYEEIFSKGIIVYFLIVNVIDKKEYIMPVQVALVLGITEKAMMSFYNSAILGKVADGDRLMSVGILENSNDIAAIMILAIPFTIVLVRAVKSKILQFLFYGILFSFYGYLIWQSKSRGAILGIGVLLVTWYWLKAKNKKIASFLVIGGLLMSLGAMSLIQRNEEDVEGSTSNRKIYWMTAIKMGMKRPVLGVGFYGYPFNLLTYADGHVGTEGQYKTAHSTWLLALAETGIPGFIFYMGIWIFAFRASWAMRYAHPEYLMALTSYGTAITFLSHTYMLYPYILLGLIIASGKFYSTSKESVQVNGLEGSRLKREYA